ncbi:MAG: hypothetical protein NPINA01_19060 [Nitrospinaceae bacterium]|nr:MAG: hypothetical protein NPINA01_19060 [Nitrospinaceae bacterium]
MDRLVMHKNFHLWMLLPIVILSAFLNTYNLDFPVFFHADEPKKIQFVLSGQQDFRHPLLMLQTARLINEVAGLKDPDRLIVLCRMISALLGVLTVILIFFIARRGLGKNFALLSALGLAVSPIFVIHAHYFKEDLIFTAFTFLSLLCFLKLLEDRTVTANLLWGLSTGLALSAQYKGIFLVLLYLGFSRMLPEIHRRWFYRNYRNGLAVMALVFLLVNYPLFFNFGNFFTGLAEETRHVIGGHKLIVYPFQHGFGFHLVNSLIPGISLIVTFLALGGLTITARSWKKADVADKLLFVYTVVFYFVHEISPMKTFPDYMRYMIPIVPALIYFACKAISQISQWGRDKSIKAVVRIFSWTLTVAVVCIPLYDTWRLDSNLLDDTRIKAKQWIDDTQRKAWGERYTLGGEVTKDLLTQVDISEAKKAGVSYLIASSFNYERFLIGSNWSGQNPMVYETQKKYMQLFSYPYVEISPLHKSFAFSNPVIRIIDIRDAKKSRSLEQNPVRSALE